MIDNRLGAAAESVLTTKAVPSNRTP